MYVNKGYTVGFEFINTPHVLCLEYYDENPNVYLARELRPREWLLWVKSVNGLVVSLFLAKIYRDMFGNDELCVSQSDGITFLQNFKTSKFLLYYCIQI